MYGIDIKKSRAREYIAYRPFMELRNLLNSARGSAEINLLRDKSLFTKFGKSQNLPVISNIGEIEDPLQLKVYLQNNNEYFVKPIDSFSGNGIVSITVKNGIYYLNNQKCDGFNDIVNSIPRSRCLIQKRLCNHNDIAKIYPLSINTLRIVTVNPKYSDNPNDIVLLGAILRMGAHGSVIDNWAKGGLVCGIGDNGQLMKYGYYKPGYGTKIEEHPDTHFKFDGFQVPYYKEALDLCKQFHSKLSKIHSIGWDVAITEDGPIFIEGNDDWELGFIQVCFGGIEKQFDTLFKEV